MSLGALLSEASSSIWHLFTRLETGSLERKLWIWVVSSKRDVGPQIMSPRAMPTRKPHPGVFEALSLSWCHSGAVIAGRPGGSLKSEIRSKATNNTKSFAHAAMLPQYIIGLDQHNTLMYSTAKVVLIC